MSEEIQGIGLDNIISIGAAVAAGGAVIFSALTYRRNKKSEQIKIASEEMDKIIKKYERLLQIKIESLVAEEATTNPLVFLYHVEEIMRECRYFGYLIHKKVIEEDDIVSYYKPEITQIFIELMTAGRDAFQKMKARSQHYPDLIKNIEAHVELVDIIIFYWG